MRLEAVTKEHVELVRVWRNRNIDAYRTAFLLTATMQYDFYMNVICDRAAKSRFWSCISKTTGTFVGMVGLENISLENRSAEISIVIDPALRGRGHGKEAIELLLCEGFNRLNLDNIYGEAYLCNNDLPFWATTCQKKGIKMFDLPRRKYCAGKYYDSIYFNFTRENV
jgi:RimJ/RimL family protein N-acetyltransferase